MPKRQRVLRGEMTEEERERARRMEKRARIARERGEPRRITEEEVARARAKVADFHNRGMSYELMSERSGVAHSVFCLLLNGRGLRRDSYDKVMAMEFHLPPERRGEVRILATGTIRRRDALRAKGYPLTLLAQLLGMTKYNLKCVGRRGHVQHRTADAIADLYNKLKDVDPAEYGVSAYGIARAKLYNKGLAPPDCWDEDNIDDPSAHPEWTGACGTQEGYLVHLREEIEPCQPCLDAYKGASPTGGLEFSTAKFAALYKERRMSGGRLSERAGGRFHADSVYRWLSGERAPKHSMLLLLAAALDCQVEDLCDTIEGGVKPWDFKPEALRRALQAQEKSKTSICQAAGISTWTMNAWLKGDKVPKLDTLGRVASALGVPWQQLYQGEDQQ